MINNLSTNRLLSPTEKSQQIHSEGQAKKWDKPADLVIILGADMDYEDWVDEVIDDAEKKGLSVALIGDGEKEITRSDIQQGMQSGAFGPQTHTLVAMGGEMQNNMHFLANGMNGNHNPTIEFLQNLRGGAEQSASSSHHSEKNSYSGTIHLFSNELGKTRNQIAKDPLLAKNGNYMLHGSAEFVSFHTIARNTAAMIDYLRECKQESAPPDYATMACRIHEITGDSLTLVGSSLEAPLLMRAPWKPEHVIPDYLLKAHIKDSTGGKKLVQGHDKDVDKLLQAKKADRPSTTDHLLHKAFNTLVTQIQMGKLDEAANLIETMPELAGKFPVGYQPIFDAIDGNHVRLLNALLRAGVSVNARSEENETPLAAAIQRGNLATVTCLIEHQAGISDLYDEEQLNLLQLAVATKRPEIVRYLSSLELFRQDEYLQYQNNDGLSALHIAAIKGDAEIVRLLLEAGVPQELEDDAGRSALWYAAESGNANAIQLLAQYRALIDLDDDEGRTPLHAAITHGNSAAMNALIKAGANALLQDDNGNTALHLAIATLDSNAIARLCRYPGLINLRNNENKTALTIAAEAGKTTIVNLLKLAGAEE